MSAMSPDEARRFLLAGTRTGKLAVVRPDGSPHVTPVWFTVDEDDVVFTTWHTSVKARALRAEPRVSLTVDDQQPPYSYVHLVGTARLSDDVDEIRTFATIIGGRYMGPDRAEEFGRRNGIPGELLVRVTPTRVIGEADISA